MTTNNLYQVLLVKKVNYEVNIVSLLALMLLMVSFIISSVSLAADSTTSRDPQPIDTTKPVEEVKPVTETKPVEEVQPVETADPLQNEPSEAEAEEPQAKVCSPICENTESPIPNYDTSTGILSIPAVSVDNSETSTFTVEMNKQSKGEFIFGLTKAKPIEQPLKVSMCNGGSWFPVPTPINLTEQDLITGNTQFPGTGTDANRAYYIASNICDSQFTVPAPNSMSGIANAGLSMVHTITAPASYLASNNSNYSFSDGLEFTCKRCGVATEAVGIETKLPPTNNGNKGMTWEKISTSLVSGIVDVGCGYSGNNHNCNPYQGDTSCSVALPVLCINKQFASPKPSWVQIPNKYHRWAGGVVATTPPVAPATNSLLSGTIADANQYCENQFGSGWQVAEFHDGWGWYFKAYGNVGTAVTRFWVDINDQDANCWTH